MRVTDELMETPGAMASHLSLRLSYRIGILSHAVHCTRAVECLTRRFFSDTLSMLEPMENTERWLSV